MRSMTAPWQQPKRGVAFRWPGLELFGGRTPLVARTRRVPICGRHATLSASAFACRERRELRLSVFSGASSPARNFVFSK